MTTAPFRAARSAWYEHVGKSTGEREQSFAVADAYIVLLEAALIDENEDLRAALRNWLKAEKALRIARTEPAEVTPE